MVGQCKAASGLELRRITGAAGKVDVVTPAFHLISGKIGTVLFVLETPRIVEDFIFRALVRQFPAVFVVLRGPARGGEGVILGGDLGRADLCAAAECVDAVR
ncbi:hypothetical protein D3C75_908870 [compost metagenome]